MKKKKVGIFVCILMISVIIYPSLKSETMEDQFSGKTSYEKFYKSNQINKIVPLGNWLDETYVVSTESDNFSYTPVLVADHDRNVHIAWTESTLFGQWYVLYKCLPKDATWDDNPWDDYPTELVSTESDPSAGPANPTMVVDESGTVHIAWKDGTDINSEDDGHWDVFYRQKSTGGNWTDNDYEQVSVETDEESCNYPTMVVDSEGTIHVVWISNDNSANGEMHYNYKPLGGDWTHTELIGSSSIDHDEPDLAIDESDNLHLVFTTQAFGGGTKQVYYRNRPYAGTWSSATKVSEASNDDSINPKLALSTDDPPTVHVTWQENYGLYHDEIFYRECEPVWNPTELVTDLSEACELPSIAVRPMLLSNHRVMIAFSHNVDSYDSEWHIQYMYKNVGDTWPTTYTTISDDATEFATSPDLCSERYYYSYRTHCAWSDTTPYSGSGPYNDIVYMKEKGEKPLGKVASKIYLYAYPEKISRYNLAKKIYGHDHHGIARAIKNEELVKRNYIEYQEKKDKNGRVINHIALSKIDPIISRIDKSPVGSKLNNYDKYVIRKILGSQGFRIIVHDDIKKLKYIPRDSLQHILVLFEIWTIISEKFRPILKNFKSWDIRTNFKDEYDYEQYLEKIKPVVKVAVPIVLKSVTQKKVMQDFLMEFDNIIELYIPDNVLRKLKPGISSIGTIYSTFEQLISNMQKHQDRAQEVLEKHGETLAKKITSEIYK